MLKFSNVFFLGCKHRSGNILVSSVVTSEKKCTCVLMQNVFDYLLSLCVYLLSVCVYLLSFCVYLHTSVEIILLKILNEWNSMNDQVNIKWMILYKFKVEHFENQLTVSFPAAVTNSCKALTERACSITKTHCDKSGGIFWKKIFFFHTFIISCFYVIIF